MTEELRQNENKISSNSFSSTMSSLLYKEVTIYELNADSYETADENSSSMTVDLHTAISTLIGKLTVLNDLTQDIIANYSSMALSQVEIYERTFFFVRKNCNGGLREALESACDYVESYCATFFDNKEFVYPIAASFWGVDNKAAELADMRTGSLLYPHSAALCLQCAEERDPDRSTVPQHRPRGDQEEDFSL
ncbi:MAG: hypothetical protein P4M11_15980 [Candidatus Pacebacteria bacterium]|nr:hypothetical protein [Candidatus Paceibacterota bacterium]